MSAWFAMENGWRPLALLLFAAVIHELGHFLVLRRYGAPVRGLRVSMLGAVMEAERGGLSYGQELLAVLAGPLANLLCAALLTLPARANPAVYTLVGAHLVLGLFNLLPIRPLDGGQILELALTWRFDPTVGEWLTRAVGAAFAGGLSLYLGYLMYASGGNLWLAPPIVGLTAIFLREIAPRSGGT